MVSALQRSNLCAHHLETGDSMDLVLLGAGWNKDRARELRGDIYDLKPVFKLLIPHFSVQSGLRLILHSTLAP